jgi:hypothetical protein
MSRSRSGKLDPDLEGVELLFHQKDGLASFGAKTNTLAYLSRVLIPKKNSFKNSLMFAGKIKDVRGWPRTNNIAY